MSTVEDDTISPVFAQTLAARIWEGVRRVMVGKTATIDLAVAALLARGHVLIENVPGTGNSTLSKALAAATPRERQSSLQQCLPGAPVAGITTAFNAACYGNIAADMGLLSELRTGFEGAAVG